MNALMLFCIYMAVVYVPWDFASKPLADDVEVWFGLPFTGVWAKIMEIPHFLVYAAGAVGFWGMRRWMWPWAALYVGQVALGMFLWPMLQHGGIAGPFVGAAAGAFFLIPTLALWRARDRFQGPRPSLRERYGDWAVVTGASSGIGAEFARAFARDGVSSVLVARREEKLQELAAELEKNDKVRTRVVTADLGRPGEAQQVLEAVADLDVAILVNNAGVGYAGRFDKLDPARLEAQVQLNCTAPVALTAGLLPAMRERGRGALIFTGSVAGSLPLPLHAVYSATKVFDNFLGEALWGELQGTGVDSLSLLPGSTETEFQETAGEIAHSGQPAHEVVSVALRALGHQPSVISGGFNWIRANLAARLLPRSVLTLIAKQVIEEQTPEELR